MDTLVKNKRLNTKPTGEVPGKSVSILEWMTALIRFRCRIRMIWLRKIWTQNLQEQGAGDGEQYSEIDGCLNGLDHPAAEAKWYKTDPILKPYKKEIAEIEKIMNKDDQSRLSLLIRIFGLDPAEKNFLYTCLSLAIESDLGRVFAYLQDHSGKNYVTTELVSRLFVHGYYFPLGPGSPLKIWGIISESVVHAMDPTRLECDPYIRNWLLGKNDLPETLIHNTRTQPVHKPLSNWPLAETIILIDRIRNQENLLPLRIFISGARGSGRSSFAASVCKHLDLDLIAIDSDSISENHWNLTFMQAQRHAYLNQTSIVWKGDNTRGWHWPPNIPMFPLQFVIGEVDEYILPLENVVDYRIELENISLEERQRLWFQLVPASATWPQKEFSEMIRRHSTGVGQIVEAANKGVRNISEAEQAMRSSSRRRLGDLAQLMVSSFTWDDLIIPQSLRESLEDFRYEASERAILWEQPGTKRLFPQGKGLFALFTGSPGTGKTMAAQVIANSLGMDLFRIDLSTIVSKYVGETSKNIERVLSRAQHMDVVLFFDEADALFGKRTEIKDAHDRFANTDTNYLLQAIEQYPGVAILASNKKSNIDSGFTRRLRYVMDFPMPDKKERLHLWRSICRELAHAEVTVSLDSGLISLADLVELSGAQIKLALLSAVFMAHREKTRLTFRQILVGLEKEMLKDERPLPRQARELFK